MPQVHYTVMSYDGKETLYTGTDKAAAELAKSQYDEEQKAKAPEGSYWTPTAKIETSLPILPENEFRVIKTREKGTILVVSGKDDTNRCLLFVGCAGGFRGGVSLVPEDTTGTILKECSAGNNCESSITVIALLEAGQTVAFHTSGRRTNEVYTHTWTGKEVEAKHFTAEEWKARSAIEAPSLEDAEVL
jgi:hypothetical protein